MEYERSVSGTRVDIVTGLLAFGEYAVEVAVLVAVDVEAEVVVACASAIRPVVICSLAYGEEL